MAQIDSRIALGFQPTTQLESPVNNLARFLQVQGAQQANQMNAMKIADAKAAGERQNKLLSLYAGEYQTPEAREDAFLRGGFREEADALRKGRLDTRKSEADAREKEFKLATDRLSLIYNAAAGAKDQASYDLALRGLQAAGIDVSNIPAQYDPAYVESAKTQALTEAQRLEQFWKQQNFDLDTQRFGETKRSNRADEALKARGQDLVNARSAEANAIMRDLNIQEKQLKIDELRSEAQGRETAKQAAADAADVQIAAIDRVLTHPGRETGTGFSGLVNPANYIPGTNATDFRVALDQVKGTAFLQAFQSLKGGGAITEIEGKKAEAAIARLDRAQSDEEFKTALEELRGVMLKGRERLRSRGTGGATSSFDSAPAKPSNVIDFGDLK